MPPEQTAAPVTEAQTSATTTSAPAETTQGTAPTTDGQAQAQSTETTATAAAPAVEPAKADDTTAAAAKLKAPEQYADFTTPEGLQFNPENREQFKAIAKELDLTQEQAQKLIDFEVQRAQASTEATKQQGNEWFAQTKNDTEIGGDKLNENAAIAGAALEKFGTPELKDLLQKTGLILHPEVIRAFHRVGKAISDDTFVGGGSATGGTAKSVAQRLYPNMNP